MKGKLSPIIREQLEMLTTLDYYIDGEKVEGIPDTFGEITFKSSNKRIDNSTKKQVIFEKYFIEPSGTFDFHKKYNNNKKPPQQIMFGFILRETNGMYYFKLKTEEDVYWEGWCPKKSCKVI